MGSSCGRVARVLYVGLSGGIGSGKSTVSARLAELGAVVLDADAVAREVVERGSEGLAEVAARFGDDVLLPDGSLNRPVLGAIVFADAGARRDLEAITHPRIGELTVRRHAAASPDAIVVHDMPLLVEGGLAPGYHLTLIVDATQETRIKRIVRDRGMTQDAARARISAQATDEQRYAVADVLLDNNGTPEELLAQVETLWWERLSPYNDNLLTDHGARRALEVRVADPDPAWPAVAARSIARLQHQLTGARLGEQIAGIDHIGSTSVPGLAAKDVIDLQVRVRALELASTSEFRAALRAAGFVEGRHSADTVHDWAPDPRSWQKYYFTGADPGLVHHVHVRQDGGPGAQVALLFRDWLRANPEECRSYEAEKHRLAQLYPGGTEQSRGDYSEGKEPWIAAALVRARHWQRTRG